MTPYILKLLLILLSLWIAKQASALLWDRAETYRMGWYQPSFTVVRMSEQMSRAEQEQ